MNAMGLAKSVVYWLEYERLCGREALFTEAALKTPVHHFLTAVEPFDVLLEHPFPGLPLAIANLPRRKKSIDFCLRRPGGNRAFKDIRESKFVNDRRAFAQEVLNDLYRLRWARFRLQSEACQRWLLIAGTWSHVRAQLLQKGSTKQHPVNDTGLYGVLHRTVGQFHTVDVRNASQRQRTRWTKAVAELGQVNLPAKFKTKLEAIFPAAPPSDSDFVCWIWRVIKPTRRHQ